MTIKKIIYIVLGCICLGLGSVGAVLPILPTTPFLLVAAFCFARSSERLNNWFKGTKLYKNNLENFVRGQGMDVKTKLRIMTTVTIIMAIAVGCMYRVPIGQICVGCVWVLHVIAFAFFIKTPEQIKKRNAKREEKRRAEAIARGEDPDKIIQEINTETESLANSLDKVDLKDIEAIKAPEETLDELDELDKLDEMASLDELEELDEVR